jgi:hypothetical protein
MLDLTTLLSISPLIILKFCLLILLGLYVIFSIIISVQARAFNRIIYVGDSFGSSLIQFLTIFHLLISISLFLLALAIL